MSRSDTCLDSMSSFKSKNTKRLSTVESEIQSLHLDISRGHRNSADDLQQMKSTMNGKRPKSRMSDSEIEESILIFNPPNWRWQKCKCQEYDLIMERVLWHNKSPWHIFTVDTPPKTCEQVAGDGNCLFRAFSFWITGSEEAHISIRDLVVREFMNRPSVYLPLTAHSSGESYMRETGMHHEGVWGTEIEIFVTATLLRTPIAVFAAFGDKALWQLFKPLETPSTSGRQSHYRQQHSHHHHQPQCSLASEPTTMLYLHNSSNHFEPVVDI